MNSKTLVETASEYLQEHKTKKGEATSAQELNRFVRWYGGNNRAAALTPLDIEKYVEYSSRSTGDLSAKMAPVKNFLNHLHESGMTQQKLAVHLKYKRSGSKSSGPRKGAKGVNYLTKEGHEKLKAEHEELVKQRIDVADDLKKAMADKDFRENAPLDAARDRQAHLEARIRELEVILKRAEVMTDNGKNATGRVRLGSRVSIKDLSDNETVAYTLVSSSEANLRESRISVDSPIGSAIYDKRAGEHIEVKAPAGIQRYVIEKVQP
ncbi:MAG: transcription elongation factor GreA [Dehalococcoidia bacterium]|nr:transcription elongation factor GreA [Dehalococcoidia bacterium]